MNSPIPSTVKRLLVVCPSWVGDTVMATPVLRALRLARPGARITVACRPGLDDLLAGAGWMDETIVGETKSLSDTLRTARRLRRQRPDAVLLLPNSFRSAMLGRLSGAPRRIGYRRYGRGPLLTDPLDPPAEPGPISTPAYYARLGAFALGRDEIERRLEVAVTPTQQAEARVLLDGVTRPFVLLCPGANKGPKRWPADRFAAAADKLAAAAGLAAVAAGSPGERDVVAAVCNVSGSGVTNLVERGVTLGGLKAVIAEASVVITNDTGPRHVAAALGTPVVTLFGPSDPRWTAIDFPQEKRLVADPFLPEELVADHQPRRCAISRITVADVLAATGQLLAASGTESHAARVAARAPTPPDVSEAR